jgi:hypothetical protein
MGMGFSCTDKGPVGHEHIRMVFLVILSLLSLEMGRLSMPRPLGLEVAYCVEEQGRTWEMLLYVLILVYTHVDIKNTCGYLKLTSSGHVVQ